MSVHVPYVHVPWNHPPHRPASEKHLLDGVDLASPLHSGYMYKEARTHLVFHRRFFVLFPRVLVYYAKEAEYKKDVARGNLEVCMTIACCKSDAAQPSKIGERATLVLLRVVEYYNTMYCIFKTEYHFVL